MKEEADAAECREELGASLAADVYASGLYEEGARALGELRASRALL